MQEVKVIVLLKIKNKFQKTRMKQLVRHEAIKFLASFVRQSRRESGCIQCQLLQSFQNPDEFSFIETWRSQKELDLYLNSSSFQTLMPLLGATLDSIKVHHMQQIH